MEGVKYTVLWLNGVTEGTHCFPYTPDVAHILINLISVARMCEE